MTHFEVVDGQNWTLPGHAKPSRTVVEATLGHVGYTDKRGIWHFVPIPSFLAWARAYGAMPS